MSTNAGIVEPEAAAARAGPPPPSLEIVSVTTTALRVELPRVYRGSKYRMTHRSTTMVRVETVCGTIGEAYGGDEDASLFEIDRIIRDEVAPAVVGLDAYATERCWQATRPATFDILRDRRLGLVACGVVDLAIWDAVGKALGQPLWRLWGGFRNRVPVISIGGYYSSGQTIEQEVAALRERGLAGMKLKVGGLTPDEDADRFRAARRTAGDDFVIAADANQGWSPSQAVRFAREVRDLGLLWFEEPCRWDNDRRGMRDVRNMAGVPVCAGQSEFSAGGCRDLMASGAIDYCNFDSSWSGGPTEWRRVAAMAAVYDVGMAHHEEPQVASHLLASIPHGSYLEIFHRDRDPIWHGLVSNKPELKDGYVELSDRPGLGWDLDQDFVDRHRVREQP